ncbi:helix-turn-helix transcriptional regulator [Sphingomonas sanguinis]|uniref:helix-turn-helix transcriptional regulator n=1 Tax=Sphingomonas sanguinis TaxID=33051 RepID=UPI00187BD90F|nr:helix-turn-helix transcriptional regulator [Sphingomonas sanguinis]
MRIYANAAEMDAQRFSRFAIEELCSIVGANMAWWGAFALPRSELEVRGSVKCGLPATWDAEWQAARRDDFISDTILGIRNRAVHVLSKDIPADNRLWVMAETFDIEQALAVAVDLGDRSGHMFVSLYRNTGRNSYTEDDRIAAELLVPHLLGAWRINLDGQVRGVSDDSRGKIARAFVDVHDRIVQTDSAFPIIVAALFPTWHGDRLPFALGDAARYSIEHGGSWVNGPRFAARASPAGWLRLIEVRRRSLIDRLTPRQHEIATLVAQGASYKEIAQRTQLTPSTVRTYIRDVYGLLGVNNKAALAMLIGEPGQHLTV